MTDLIPSMSDRDVRQRAQIPPLRLVQCDALVIGVGAIGRQVALQLAAIGMPRLTLFDHDLVQADNLAAQGYWPEDLHQSKVNATAQLCRRIHPVMKIRMVAEHFQRSSARGFAVHGELIAFCCVASTVKRRMIWESLRSSAQLFVDGQRSADVVRVLASDQPAVDDSYARALVGADEAYAGAGPARSTIYTAPIAAGLMVHQCTQWLRGLPVDPDRTLHLLTGELTHRDR